MKTLQIIILPVFAALFFFTSCDAVVEGNGIVSTEIREPESFTSIEASNHFSIVLKKSDNAYVEIEADQNLLPLIQTVTEDGCLRIYHKDILKSSNDIVVRIGYTQLNEIEISGSVKLHSEDTLQGENFLITMSGASVARLPLSCDKAEIEISGASELLLSGSATEAILSQTGASVVSAYDFSTQKMNVRSSGSSQAEISVISSLQVKASGASSLTYCGNPLLKKNISAAANVKKSEVCD